MPLRIGMIDVDLLNNGTRHPNLAQMKISAYCKRQGHNVRLIYKSEELSSLPDYDFVFVSKVFNYTPVPQELVSLIENNTNELDPLETRYRAVNVPSIIETLGHYSKILKRKPSQTIILIGGTGFFEDGGRDLDREIELGMPDYELYNEYVTSKIEAGREKSYYSDYQGCSIGFITRGGFRKCPFCVN